MLAMASAVVYSCIGLTSCSDNDDLGNTNKKEENNKGLKGVWEVKGARIEGGNVTSKCPLAYFIIDPETNDMVIFGKDSETGQVQLNKMEELKIDVSGDTVFMISPLFYEEYEKNPEKWRFNNFRATLSENDNTLEIDPLACAYLPEEFLEGKVEDVKNVRIHITLNRATDIEESKTDSTRGLFSWIAEKVVSIVNTVLDTVLSNDEVYERTVKYEPWKNTDGWEYKNWMKNLPDAMPVCWVNIPGSHDSSTDTGHMSVEAIAMSADCQSIPIEMQFDRGARYFDFRIGTNMFEAHAFNLLKGDDFDYKKDDNKIMDHDLMMYHGCFETSSYFRENMEMLAKKVQNGSEFVFVNTQWESLSMGLIEDAAVFLHDLFGHKDYANQIRQAYKGLTMYRANYLERKLNEQYGTTDNPLFIVYKPSLTVKQARGHIILWQENYDSKESGANPQVSYVYGWPDNKCGLAYIGPWNTQSNPSEAEKPYMIEKNGRYYNCEIQSIYEMPLRNTTKIDNKKKEMKNLAETVTEENRDKGLRILGFSSTNANSGLADLDTYEYAHIFNGYGFNMYVENMKEESIEKRYHCGLVPMDHYGAREYNFVMLSSKDFLHDKDASVYGDYLSWAIIESNFYNSPNKEWEKK